MSVGRLPDLTEPTDAQQLDQHPGHARQRAHSRSGILEALVGDERDQVFGTVHDKPWPHRPTGGIGGRRCD